MTMANRAYSALARHDHQLSQMEHDAIWWAQGALRRQPLSSDCMGLSYQQASCRAQAVCYVAARTGQTINASAHLSRLVEVMKMGAAAAA